MLNLVLYLYIWIFALTVHKYQERTYHTMIRNRLSKSGVEPGQMYTILSNETSSKCLKLLRFERDTIIVNKSALSEMTKLRKHMQLKVLNILVDYEYRFVPDHTNIILRYQHFTLLNVDIICLNETHIFDEKDHIISDMFILAINSGYWS